MMEDDSLRFGPNGGLVFCMEYFANNFDWLEESLGHVEDDYILFDCPGKCFKEVMLKPDFHWLQHSALVCAGVWMGFNMSWALLFGNFV